MDNSQAIACASTAIGRVDIVPTLLKVLCEMTGLRFAAVARVEGTTWTAYALRDDLSLGAQSGDELSFITNLGFDSQAARLPIVFEQPDIDLHSSRQTFFSVRSFISVPIYIDGERQFGALCALDSNPTNLREPR